MSKKLALIASKGSLDMAYPPFILASTAAALDYEVQVFFTFYGLQLLRKDLGDLRISPLGNPAMPMPIPVLLRTLPGMESLATAGMRAKLQAKGIASLEELRGLCLEGGVRFIACQMTMDLFDIRVDDLIPEIELGGAATYFEFAGQADVSLFV